MLMSLILPGVSSFDVSLEKQEVTVKGTLPYAEVLEKIKKTGKEACPSLLGFSVCCR